MSLFYDRLCHVGGSYGLNELKGDLQAMYKKAGERDEGRACRAMTTQMQYDQGESLEITTRDTVDPYAHKAHVDYIVYVYC
eukprot:3993417-Amphidinium_carterae.1